MKRARIKSFENLPEWLKCCPQMIEETKETTGQVITITEARWRTTVKCGYCGSEKDGKLYTEAKVNGGFIWIPLEVLDIDEGETSDN
jgi:hypothetical protein